MAANVLDFNYKQLNRISKGFELGLSREYVAVYANPVYAPGKMEVIKNCLLKNYDPKWVDYFSKGDNDEKFIVRMYELISMLLNYRLELLAVKNEQIGLVEYAKKYRSYIIELEDKKTTNYDDPTFWSKHRYCEQALNDSLIREYQIKRLAFLMGKGLQFDCIIKAIFLPNKEFEEFAQLDIESYNEKQFDAILDGMNERVEYKVYISSDFSATLMRSMLEALVEGVDPKRIRDNIWVSSSESDVKRLIREKNAYRTNQISYQNALKKYKDIEIRRCIVCEEYYPISDFWDLNVDNAICSKCHNK